MSENADDGRWKKGEVILPPFGKQKALSNGVLVWCLSAVP